MQIFIEEKKKQDSMGQWNMPSNIFYNPKSCLNFLMSIIQIID